MILHVMRCGGGIGVTSAVTSVGILLSLPRVRSITPSGHWSKSRALGSLPQSEKHESGKHAAVDACERLGKKIWEHISERDVIEVYTSEHFNTLQEAGWAQGKRGEINYGVREAAVLRLVEGRWTRLLADRRVTCGAPMVDQHFSRRRIHPRRDYGSGIASTLLMPQGTRSASTSPGQPDQLHMTLACRASVILVDPISGPPLRSQDIL